MAFHYPSLSLYEIERVFEFYHANEAAVNDFARRYRAELTRIEAATPRGPSRAELLARLDEQTRARFIAANPG